MTTVCRIPLKLGDDVPQLACTFEDGFMVVRVPTTAQIIDPTELCQHMRCRKLVTKGGNGQNLTHCEEHAAYYRLMQKQNYAKHISKNMLGLCAFQGCHKPQTKSKKSENLGRCCVEHANRLNQVSKNAYKRRKHATE